MKTSRHLRVIVGCFACAASVLAMSCTNTIGEDKQLPDKHDTTTLVDTLMPFGVHRITIGAAGGEQEVEFAPNGDWTFSSATDWLKVTTAAGKAADKLLKFTTAPFDEIGGKREAVTTVTVDGIAKTVKFTQVGASRFVHVYDVRTIIYDNSLKSVRISNIVSNVELEIAAFPDWIKSATLSKDPVVDTQYVIDLTLSGTDFDDMVRYGAVVLRDKNFPEFTYDVPVDLTGCTENYFVSAGFSSDHIFSGGGTDEERSSTFSVMSSPSKNDYTVLFYTKDMRGDFNVDPEKSIKYELAPIAPLAAYVKSDYVFTIDSYTDVATLDVDRTFYMMLVPNSEMGNGKPIAMKPEYEMMSFKQNRLAVLKMISPVGTGPTGSIFKDIKIASTSSGMQSVTITPNEAVTTTINLKVVSGYVPRLKMQDTSIPQQGGGPAKNVSWNGSIDTPTVDSDSEAGWDVYTYTVTCPKTAYTGLPSMTASLAFNLLISVGDTDWDPVKNPTAGYKIKFNYAR